jgi:hypothetical protein
MRSFFLRKDENFFAETGGPGGRPALLEVKYAFTQMTQATVNIAFIRAVSPDAGLR